jgi:hypothetical protein
MIHNSETQQNSVIEILDTIHTADLPSTLGPMGTYARLVGGVGSYAFRFEIHGLVAREIVIATPESLIEFGNTDEVVTLTARLSAFEVTGAGPHDLVMFADHQDLRRRFTFRVISYPGEREDSGTQDTEEP